MRDEILHAIEQGNVRAFYKCREWQAKRVQIIRRDNRECQECKSEGKYSRGNVVHHIKHLVDRPDLALDDDNLVTVCEVCHNRLHPEKLPSVGEGQRRQVTPERW